MKEIEIKIKIGSAKIAIEQLTQQGCKFTRSVTQSDIIYVPQAETLLPVKPGINILRIRQEEGKILLTLKQSDPENHLSKTEKELEIGSVQVMQEIITLLGFHEISRVKKQRRKCKLQDYEICIDEVENLGSFLEIEKITDEDPAVVQEQMLQQLTSLGIDVSEQVYLGYDILMVQKHGY
jgi:adenylate cyclase class 2